MSELEVVDHVDRPAWVSAPQTRAVMNALGHDRARFVGGCVRNTLLGMGVSDIDIATQHTPEEVLCALEAAGIKAIPTGIDHGTVTAVIDHQSFEITSLRKDVRTDGRRAVVTFTQDWREDAQRRDFTMNTLLMDVQGRVYDPTQQGLNDLHARRVVFVGDEVLRIAEDRLRILRFFRFHGAYGQGVPDAAALEACRGAAYTIKELSRERISQEFFKIIAFQNPAPILQLMFDNRVLREFNFKALSQIEHLSRLQEGCGRLALSARLLVLMNFDVGNMNVFEDLLVIPKAEKKEIKALSTLLSGVDLNYEESIKVALYRHGHKAVVQAVLCEVVQGRVDEGYIESAFTLIDQWDIPKFDVTGADLIARGFTSGPALGAELLRLEEEWIARGFMRD